ncbi:MAG: Sulfur carrier protein FdhD [Anaerolineales bacterium]|nr:Sulfur carrier protein FdhD [Anaerolineales bacterium]
MHYNRPMLEPRKSIRYIEFDVSEDKAIESQTIVESPVSLTVNGEVWVSLMCTPVHLEALAVGFLFNEGVIDSMEDVADVRVCEHGDNVDIWLTREAEKPSRWTRTSGCSGGMTAVDSIQRPRSGWARSDFSLPVNQIARVVEMLFESQELYRETGGVHTSVLTDGERIIVAAEDIGRHNTLDKIAGLCLMRKIQPERRILITTGRISSEMLQKAVRFGANILISRTSPSSLSIELAEKWGITLIGYARRNRFNLYAGEERILRTPDDVKMPG